MARNPVRFRTGIKEGLQSICLMRIPGNEAAGFETAASDRLQIHENQQAGLRE